MARTHINVKIFDVLHDPLPDHQSPNDLEYLVKQNTTHTAIKDIHIHPGTTNTPITIELEAGRMTPGLVTKTAEKVIHQFATYVDGIDIENTLRNDNVRIHTPE